MKEVTANCYINGKAKVTITVPDNYTDEEIYEEIEKSVDIGDLDYSLTDMDIEIDLIRNISS